MAIKRPALGLCVTLVTMCTTAALQVRVVSAQSPADSAPTFTYGVPLDPHSPWPKFRRDARQDGRSPVLPRDSGRAPWTFHTGKGVFSSPVVDGDGTVYVGSADRTFYAINRDGTLKWKFLTGQIIDSAALVDDAGRVFFGSGDGRLYALDRNTGEALWTFAADNASVNSAFINWFEGNVAIGPDGMLYVPNDNFCTYGIRREHGERVWCWKTLDQTWDIPAVDPQNGHLFIGSNFAFLRNTYALDGGKGTALWHVNVDGSVVASPLLTGVTAQPAVVVGAFDGYLRAYDPGRGRERWRFGARDHFYASASEAADGTIIQAGADGSVYALDPVDGSVRWIFDTLEPIRSSPSIDGAGNIYFGSGDGRLYVLNPDGTPRWSIRLIDEARNDLNASPALGTEAIIIAGENGGIFSIPYDYCLRPGLNDPRCIVGASERLATDGVFLLYTTQFGNTLLQPPADIAANQPLTLSLFVRRAGHTQLALLDSEHLRAALTPEVPARIDVSGDRRFMTIVPKGTWTDAAGGALAVRVQGTYLVNPQRRGLRFTVGKPGGQFDQTFRFAVRPHAGGSLPLPVPEAPGEAAGVWELYRLAAPLPTILPSYNQIGFDSIHYMIGLVEGDATHAIAWGVGGRLADAGDRGEIDPGSRIRFPVEVRADAGLLTLINEGGFTIEFNGFPLPFDFFRVATQVNARGEALYSPAINAKTTCGNIDFYGEFVQVLGYCSPTTDVMSVFGGAELRPFGNGVQSAPEGVGQVRFDGSYDHVTATFTGSALRAAEHNFGLLLIDPATRTPLPVRYMTDTATTATPAGTVATVALSLPAGAVHGAVRVYAMVDTYPAAMATVSFPETVPWRARVSGALQATWGAAKRFGGRVGRRIALKLLRVVS